MIAGRIAAVLPEWRASRWEVRRAGAWTPMPRAVLPVIAISACNPGALRLSAKANRDRDEALHSWLHRQGIQHQLCRGVLCEWSETAWLMPDGPSARRLIAAFGQLAGQRWDVRGVWLIWRWNDRRRIA